MSLDGAMSVAAGGLANIEHRLGVVSRNIANASTPDYAAEIATQRAVTANGTGLGVLSGASVRALDAQLQAAAFAREGEVGELSTISASLGAIDAALGSPGQGDDLGSALGGVAAAFSALLQQPDNQAAQSAVVARAQALAGKANALSAAYAEQRQGAHDDLGRAVAELNGALSAIGALNTQIVALRSGGASTADLENMRDAQLRTVSKLVGARAVVREDGSMLVATLGGLALPTRAGQALSIAPANLGDQTYYPGGGVPGVALAGQDVTAQLTGGRIGGDLALRDRMLPMFQAQLDEFAATLASRFDGQGLALFVDPAGAVPGAGAHVGFAAGMRVAADVAADPALTRDGNRTVAGSPTGPSAFVPNPAGGPAGFSKLIQRVLDHALGTEVQPGVAHAPPAVSGRGPRGDISFPFAPPASLADFATAVASAQSGASADISDRLGTQQALRDRLSSRLSTQSGVSMDTELGDMLALQNAYAANARVMTVVKGLPDQLMDTVR